jgi:uncharacterized membrane protein YphA (DoxX/SURF4 family)
MAKAGNTDRHTQGSKAGMVLLRIALGLFFAHSAAMKFRDPIAFSDDLRTATTSGGTLVAGNALPGFAAFLQQTISPNAEAAAWVIMIAQAVIAALFMLGLLTRLAALIASGSSLLVLLATAAYVPASLVAPHVGVPSPVLHAGIFLVALALLVSAAGRTFGLDYYLARRTRLKLLW